MPENMSEKEIYEEAKKNVKAKRDFYRNLWAYLVVNAILFVIWLISDSDLGTANMWFLWPLGIWGVIVAANFLQVFVFGSNAMQERTAIEKEAEKIKKGKDNFQLFIE